MLNEIGKINVVCEGFIISETHDAYSLILNLYFRLIYDKINFRIDWNEGYKIIIIIIIK